MQREELSELGAPASLATMVNLDADWMPVVCSLLAPFHRTGCIASIALYLRTKRGDATILITRLDQYSPRRRPTLLGAWLL